MNREYLLHRNGTILQVGQSPSQEAVNALARDMQAETLWGPFERAPDPERHRVVVGCIVPRDDIEDRKIREAWTALRHHRDRLLAESDYSQLPDAPGDRAAWAAYRQALRDLPDTIRNPQDVTWPQPPASTPNNNNERTRS